MNYEDKLIKVGYWYSEYEPDLPRPQENSNTLTQKQTDEVIEYLRLFTVFNSYRGFSKCRICNIHNGSVDHTDGRHMWPSGLAHYLEEHNVGLPKEFTDSILGRAR